MSSHVDASGLGQTSETTSLNKMYSFDLSGHRSSRYEGVNGNGIYSCPVPTTSVQREEMRASLRGNTDTPLLSGPQITMVSSSSSVDASGLTYGDRTLLGRGAVGNPDRSAKSGGTKSQESDKNADEVKRNSSVNQLQESEQRPQIYPWMTKLHMSHGKVCLIPKVRLKCFPLFTLNAATLLFARSSVPLEFYRPKEGNNKN